MPISLMQRFGASVPGILLIATVANFYVFSFKAAAKDLENVKGQLIQQTSQLQKMEKKIFSSSRKVAQLIQEEKKASAELISHQHLIVAALQNLRHWAEFSPFLIALSQANTTDLIHSIMLVNSLSPELQRQNTYLFNCVKKNQELRKKIADEHKYAREISNRYAHLLGEQHLLLQRKNTLAGQKPSNLKSANASLSVDKNLEVVLDQLSVASSNKKAQNQQSLSLLSPVNGVVSKGAEGLNLPENLRKVLMTGAKILSYPDAHVIAPCSAKVVNITFIPNHGYLLVLQQEGFIVILAGIGNIYCHQGESLRAGEPIGCMSIVPSFAAKNKIPSSHPQETLPLLIALRKGKQFIDPTSYLKSNDA